MIRVGPHFHAVWDRMGSSFGSIHTEMLGKFRDMGATLLRLDVYWETFQPSNSTQFVSRVHNGKLDDTIDWCETEGIECLIVPTRAPAWAHAGSQPRLPDDPVTCRQFGEKFSDYFGAWTNTMVEFWNEPDLTSFETGGPRPSHYVDCLQQFYLGVQDSSTPIPVVFGAPSLIAVVSGGNDRHDFIGKSYDRMNALGGIRPYDHMAVHCYPGVDGPSIASSGTQNWRLDHMRYLLARMDTEGDARTVYITEGGYSSHSNADIPGQPPQPSWEAGVTEALQGSYTAGMASRIKQDWPTRVEGLVVYNDWEKGDPLAATTTSDRHQFGFGILRYADRATTKPVYTDLASLLPGINEVPPVPDSDPASPTTSNTFDALGDGTAVTTGNSGGTNGQAFDAVVGTVVARTSAAFRGTRGATFELAASQNSYVEWTDTKQFFEVYYRPTTSGNPGYNIRLAKGVDGTGTMLWEVRHTTGGLIDFMLGASQRFFSSAFMTAGSWYRLEWTVPVGTNTTIEMRIYLGDATTPLETLTRVSTPTAWTAVRFGHMANSNATGTVSLDRLATHTTWVGVQPLVAASAFTGWGVPI